MNHIIDGESMNERSSLLLFRWYVGTKGFRKDNVYHGDCQFLPRRMYPAESVNLSNAVYRHAYENLGGICL